jgi:5'(3')-deoxyribonucleotidase
MKTRVIIDVDNTLADSIRSWCLLAKEKYGVKVEYNSISSPKLVGCVPMDSNLIFSIQDEVWKQWSTLPPTERGLGKLVQDLRKLGYEIIIATSGPSRHVDCVKKWLAYNQIECLEFHSVSSKSSIRAHVLVDDSVEEVSAFVSEEREALLYDRPWNRTKSPEGANRIKSLQDLVVILPKLKKPLAHSLDEFK